MKGREENENKGKEGVRRGHSFPRSSSFFIHFLSFPFLPKGKGNIIKERGYPAFPSLLVFSFSYLILSCLIFSFERKGKERRETEHVKGRRRKREEEEEEKEETPLPSPFQKEIVCAKEEHGKGGAPLVIPPLLFPLFPFRFLRFPFLSHSFLLEAVGKEEGRGVERNAPFLSNQRLPAWAPRMPFGKNGGTRC